MRTGQPGAPWARLAAIAALYVSLGAVLGFVQGGVGPILRGKGHALTSMAPVFALYLPFGVTFLWAPPVDRWRLPWLGRRSGWIVAWPLYPTYAAGEGVGVKLGGRRHSDRKKTDDLRPRERM
ncbi:hypothetical protein HGQ98_29405 [Achromobacter ruhlandii]|uniref:Uncharacterized protein n=1 Tax=Achromobacter ruhlandii TaxID=72557 RepID=A0A848NVI6_9BURK|nr:hypothetical protein [Achromobacter ruhlandii]NMU93505.1 hypothetical protein [Achromobacter ruhlandii]